MYNGKVRLDICHSGTSYTWLAGNTVMSANVWHHVAAVFDGNECRVYLDGVLDGGMTSTFAPYSGTGNLIIGRARGDPVQYFNGLIDEVRVIAGSLYTSNFTPAAHLEAVPNMAGLWKFDNQTASDSSSNGNNGTAQGSATFSSDVKGDSGGGTTLAQLHWLVTDQLGTPRMIIDQTGALANVKRHDYLPFGEELFAGTGGRTPALGYSGDSVRQKFTQKERDIETGLDYFVNRYYSSTQGRFTSVDPTLMSIDPGNPQTLNRYTYALNNPLAFVDPDGLEAVIVGGYNDLTDEQKRLFQTYVNKNYADQIGDMKPADFAERLWNESALVANTEGGDASVVGSNILTQSQLTTFLGVTNMLESRGVSGEVASITSINGDIPKHEFRLIGELKNNSTSVEAIDKAFSHDIAGKGHSPYDVSKREQGMFGQPNGQVTRIPNGTGVDVDVDYRKLIRFTAHNTRENSDIRADDGNTSHYRRNIERYGPIRALTPVNPTFIKQKE